MDAAPRALFERAANAHHTVLALRHSFDPFYGRRIAGDLEDAGLTDIGTDGRAAMWRGGGAGGRIWRLSIEQLRDQIVALDLLSQTEFEAALTLCDDPRLTVMSPVMMGAWGRRPV
jgi:hypothetical protein